MDVEFIDAAELRRREPHVRGVGALFVPDTGIVDYRRITDALAMRCVPRAGRSCWGRGSI
ncbi:FAD-dependent oxidoreductase, partial [Nocardia cyriacigeorgica]|uniref:FAD-dependent oxidoreductase n=1 Tax=Nocardia cyriacigeorgica TaxID=135487 RepID=UPI00313E6651